MDRKTLEYMEERVLKAKAIVIRIDDLKKTGEKATTSDYVIFDGKYAGSYAKEEDFTIVNKTRNAFKTAVAEEIERLEQELAEL